MRQVYLMTIIFLGLSISTLYADIANGGFEITSGSTVTLNAGRLVIRGNWTNNGLFSHNGGTVTFQGALTTSTISGQTAFLNLECIDAGKTLKFVADSTQTVTGNLVINGQSGSLISLISSSLGNRWYLDIPYEDKILDYVSVQDAYALSNIVVCNNSLDAGNNYRWIFDVAGPPQWVSPALVHTGYTLDTTPKLWFSSADRFDIEYSSAQIVFATDDAFTQNVSTFTSPATGWDGIPAAPLSISTYTVQTPLSVDTTYYARVRFYDNYFWSVWSSTLTVLVKDTAWTDDTLLISTTPIRAVHFSEIKSHIDQIRIFRGLGLGSWASFDSEVVVGLPIRADHINKLRTNLTDVWVNEGESVPVWTDSTITPAITPIRRQHIYELRQKCLLGQP